MIYPSEKMRIKPCPKCNRLPVITECKQRNGVRRRLIKCPNYCSCLLPLRDIDDERVEKSPWENKWGNSAMLVFLGDGDDNAIYKVWNSSITEENAYCRPYMCHHFKWTSWNHYGQKMPELACKLKGGEMGSCQGICEQFKLKEEYDAERTCKRNP